MIVRIAKKLGSVATILLVMAALLGCNSSDGTKNEVTDSLRQQVTELRPVHWKMSGEPSERTVRISSEVGYCDGSPVPRIQRVRVEERARKVSLTAMLTTPVRPTGVACADVRLGVTKTVTLKRDLAGRAIYDASFSPPKKRWPR